MVQELCRNLQEFLTSHGIPDWLVVFIISLCPILECRLGMFTAIVLLQMNPFVGFIISFLGNILPIPFILLLINWIFDLLKKVPGINKFVYWLEDKTLKKRDKIDKYGIWGFLFLWQFRFRVQADGPVHFLLPSSFLIRKRVLL